MGEQVNIGYGLHSTRLTEPAMTLEQLPPLDFVMLSHMHEDHFDRVVERELNKLLPIMTNPSAAAVLKKKGFSQAYGIKTWKSVTLSKGTSTVRITSLPAKHAPVPLKFLLPPVMGSMRSSNLLPVRLDSVSILPAILCSISICARFPAASQYRSGPGPSGRYENYGCPARWMVARVRRR